MAKRKPRKASLIDLADKHINKIKENSNEVEIILQALIENKDKLTEADKLFITKEMNRINNKAEELFKERTDN